MEYLVEDTCGLHPIVDATAKTHLLGRRQRAPAVMESSFLHLKCYMDFWLMTVNLTHTAKLVFCCVCVLSHVQLFVTPRTVAHQAPLSMETSQARILERVAISSFRDLPDSGIEPVSLAFPTLAGRFFTTSATKESERNTNCQIEEHLKNNKVFG